MSNKGLVLKENITNIAEAIREPLGLVGKNQIDYTTVQSTPNTTVSIIQNGFKASGIFAGRIDVSGLKRNTNYYLQYEIENIVGNTKNVGIFGETAQTSYVRTFTNETGGTFNTGNHTDINIWFYCGMGTQGEANFTNIQLTEGTESTPYEPYCRYKVRDMNSTIENLVDKLKSYIPHTATSGNPVNITNAIQLKPKVLEFDGDIYQDSTTGKQLLELNTLQNNNYNINTLVNIGNIADFKCDFYVERKLNIGKNFINQELKNASDCTTTIKIKNLQPNTQYTISADVSTNISGNLFILGTNYSTIPSKAINTFTTDENGEKQLTHFYVVTRMTGMYLNISNIQLEEGSTATPYEPYTGGMQSPNPAYPQPINVVKSTSGVINYNMVENLFDSEAWFNSISTSSSYYINRKIKENNKYKFIGNNSTSRIDTGNRYSTTIKPNTDYVFTFDYNSTATPNASISLFISNDYTIDTMKYGTYRIGEINPSSGKAVLNFNSENNTLFYFHGYTNYAEISNTLEIWNIMLIEKDFIKTIPFNIGSTEFYKLPNNVSDKLWVNLKTGQYGKTKNINKRIYNGSENWEVWVTSVPDITTFYLGNAISDKKVSSINNSISNYFKVDNEYGTYNYQHLALSSINSNISITLNNTELQTIDSAGIKQWLSTHNTELYYELANPTTEILGTLSKENLAKLVMYNRVNNIELSGYDDNGAEPIIEIDYYTQVL